MRWLRLPLQTRDRALELSKGGKWFLVFTVALGAVAVRSGNNVIYLFESLALSAIILSGIVSEITIRGVRFQRTVRAATVQKKAEDKWTLENTSVWPLFYIEFGEWSDNAFVVHGVAPYIGPKAKAEFVSGQVYKNRGRYTWDSLAISTGFPFGFAKKMRIVSQPGSRIIWPAGKGSNEFFQMTPSHERALVEGELQEIHPWQDMSRIHWPVSMRAGRPMAFAFKQLSNFDEFKLSLPDSDTLREQRISLAAGAIHFGVRSLVIHSKEGVTRHEGSWASLDALALLPKGGEP